MIFCGVQSSGFSLHKIEYYNGITDKNGAFEKYSAKHLDFCEKARKIDGGFGLINTDCCQKILAIIKQIRSSFQPLD
ncbi:MAG: hypothetical protein IJV35_05425 [Neisseriaceae bacterium]|nr:hypothetical protein [Neisseriaceae bacterium]